MLVNDKEYKAGDFCKSIKCEHTKALLSGDKSNCYSCKAYQFHDYLEKYDGTTKGIDSDELYGRILEYSKIPKNVTNIPQLEELGHKILSIACDVLGTRSIDYILLKTGKHVFDIEKHKVHYKLLCYSYDPSLLFMCKEYLLFVAHMNDSRILIVTKNFITKDGTILPITKGIW